MLRLWNPTIESVDTAINLSYFNDEQGTKPFNCTLLRIGVF